MVSDDSGHITSYPAIGGEMKTVKQIKRQISELKRLSERTPDQEQKTAAYEAYHALRWVIENVDWTPARICRINLGGKR